MQAREPAGRILALVAFYPYRPVSENFVVSEQSKLKSKLATTRELLPQMSDRRIKKVC
jgi:hypothetical protein